MNNIKLTTEERNVRVRWNAGLLPDGFQSVKFEVSNVATRSADNDFKNCTVQTDDGERNFWLSEGDLMKFAEAQGGEAYKLIPASGTGRNKVAAIHDYHLDKLILTCKKGQISVAA